MCSSGTQCSSEHLVRGERSMLEGGSGGNWEIFHLSLGLGTCRSPDSSHSHRPRQPWAAFLCCLRASPHPSGTTFCFPSVQATGNKQGGRVRAGRKGCEARPSSRHDTQLALLSEGSPQLSWQIPGKIRQDWKPLRSSGQGEAQLPLGTCWGIQVAEPKANFTSIK